MAGKLTSRWSANSSQMRRPSTQQRKAATGDDALWSLDPTVGLEPNLVKPAARLGFWLASDDVRWLLR